MISTVARRLLLPRDTWERHALVARQVAGGRSVLDVGGRPGELAPFLPGSTVTTLNVDPPADVVWDGERLPFPDGSFDVVTSLDVLEHLPRDRRRPHLEELVRIARRQVVACCPLGTPEHVAAEREVADWYTSVVGAPHRFLEEHLTNGLPTEEELRELVEGLAFRFELSFHGDFRRTNSIFRMTVRRDVLRYGREALRPLDAELRPQPTKFTNRAFLVGHAP